MPTAKLRFRDYELDPDGFELCRAGHRVRLERKPIELLILLAENQGIAPVEQVLELANPLATELGVVSQGTAPFRWKHARVPALVVVVLIAAAFALNLAGIRSRVFARRVPPIHSIAVLPLQNLSGDANQEYFADGMTDALITNLAQFGSLRVISRTSAMHYKGSHKSLPEIGARCQGSQSRASCAFITSTYRYNCLSGLG